jgi:hypothetical protein
MNPEVQRRGGDDVERAKMGIRALLRHPSAFVPPALSLAALAVVAGHIALFGGAREPDEGAAAHLWQLLMVGQVPFVMIFVVKWLPRAPRAALAIFVLQLAAAAGAAAPVFLLGL